MCLSMELGSEYASETMSHDFAFVWEWIVQLTKMFSSGLLSIIAEMHLRHGGRGKRAESFLPNKFGSSSRSLTSHPQNDKVSGPSLQ